jgi:two-component system, NarL family, nitrate/nitrite response regulator NarL
VPLRCLIVDDNASFLEAARTLLERQGMRVAGVATNVADALRQARELRPDVVLVDILLGGESGFDVARQLVGEDGNGPPVILVSTHAETDFEDLIRATPAAGFVPKAELSAEAIRRLVG